MPPKRWSARDWIELGVSTLCETGPDAMTIEALCRQAGRTKGSFYAHFANMEAFTDAIAAYWKEANTEAVKRSVDEAERAARPALLNQLAAHLDPRFDRAMRRLAERQPAIAETVLDVDRSRLAYLGELYRAAGLDAERASEAATIDYAAYVGLPQILTETGPEHLRHLSDVLTARLTAKLRDGSA